jgi:hypothetical protein
MLPLMSGCLSFLKLTFDVCLSIVQRKLWFTQDHVPLYSAIAKLHSGFVVCGV